MLTATASIDRKSHVSFIWNPVFINVLNSKHHRYLFLFFKDLTPTFSVFLMLNGEAGLFGIIVLNQNFACPVVCNSKKKKKASGYDITLYSCLFTGFVESCWCIQTYFNKNNMRLKASNCIIYWKQKFTVKQIRCRGEIFTVKNKMCCAHFC